MAEGLPPLTPQQRMRYDHHGQDQWNALRRQWAHTDADLQEMVLDSPAAIARWQELQHRDRELRTYFLNKRAVFRGTIAAHFALGAIALALWGVATLVLRIV